MNEPTPEKVTVHRVAYHDGVEFQGYEYYPSKVNAHFVAERGEECDGYVTIVDALKVELSPRGICDLLNEHAIVFDPDGSDRWCPEKDYPGREVVLQVRKGPQDDTKEGEILATFRRFTEVKEFFRERGLKRGDIYVTVGSDGESDDE